jgi:hypothetical protein
MVILIFYVIRRIDKLLLYLIWISSILTLKVHLGVTHLHFEKSVDFWEFLFYLNNWRSVLFKRIRVFPWPSFNWAVDSSYILISATRCWCMPASTPSRKSLRLNCLSMLFIQEEICIQWIIWVEIEFTHFSPMQIKSNHTWLGSCKGESPFLWLQFGKNYLYQKQLLIKKKFISD